MGDGLAVFDPPLRLPSFTIETVWHERTHNEPGHAWLRGCISDVARRL
jgi:hypothetical protein